MLSASRRAGSLVGPSLIAFDCAFDDESDKKRGHFHPLDSPSRVRSASKDATADPQIRLGEEPAKTDGPVVEVGEKVVVIRKDAFGGLVRRAPIIPASGGEPPHA